MSGQARSISLSSGAAWSALALSVKRADLEDNVWQARQVGASAAQYEEGLRILDEEFPNHDRRLPGSGFGVRECSPTVLRIHLASNWTCSPDSLLMLPFTERKRRLAVPVPALGSGTSLRT
jgi:hypothetical protein